MRAQTFIDALGAEFFTGVPDSLLKPFCDCLMRRYGISGRHIVAANEGNSVALAAGYHLATGKVPVVYMQNSGIGNVINPVASLLNEKVYGIPCLFVVGWRGEPGTKDEPQHVFQGEVTQRLLEDVGIETFILRKDTTEEALRAQMDVFRGVLDAGRCAAFIVQKGALSDDEGYRYENGNAMLREDIVAKIAEVAGEDPILSTTGKASRELFETRERRGQPHQYDFLTVGSMGHCSSIALGVALYRPERRVWCIDGDGAALMHMGAMAVIGAEKPANLIHVVINNGAHETVGGMPTMAGQIDLVQIARSCGYPSAVRVESMEALEQALLDARASGTLCLIEARASLGAREDLGRPTTTAMENKRAFMEYLAEA